MNNNQNQYDSAWKDIIENLFEEFLAFFFPQFYRDIDFSKGYQFLDKELGKITKDTEIGNRYADKLVKVFLKDGEEKWLLIHIEVQGYKEKEKEFETRIFVYNYRIYNKYGKEVVTLVILTDEDKKYRPDKYHFKLHNFEVYVKYPLVKLIDYAGEEEELKRSKNPFALVVLAHLKSLKVKKDEERKYRAKKELILLLNEKGYSKEEKKELLIFIDWVLSLSREYEEKLEKEVGEEVMPYITSWERKGLEKGLYQKAIETAKNMIKRGFDIRTISEITGLSEEEINKCRVSH